MFSGENFSGVEMVGSLWVLVNSKFVSRADVADFLVKQIDDDAFLHKAPVLTS
jgi:hypothetical protein